jgi:2-polyprenyl-6-methoxyphenol hydroxylase-like FAD-dependent oxidoreductase
MTEMTDVVIIGAGPAGLLLASELRLAHVTVVVIERDRQRPGYCRGFNLNARALDLGADIRRGHDLRTVEQGHESIDATVTTAEREYRIRARYLAGCDGGRSTVRKQTGIDFPGTEATRFSRPPWTRRSGVTSGCAPRAG